MKQNEKFFRALLTALLLLPVFVSVLSIPATARSATAAAPQGGVCVPTATPAAVATATPAPPVQTVPPTATPAPLYTQAPVAAPASGCAADTPQNAPDVQPVQTTRIWGASQRPADGAAYGTLEIPSADISARMVWSFAEDVLRAAETAATVTYYGWPGSGVETVLCAHNNTDFGRLGRIAVGDTITVDTAWGHFAYSVTFSAVGTVSADETQLLDGAGNVLTDTAAPAAKERLVLFTCYPFDTAGATQQRYVVLAEAS